MTNIFAEALQQETNGVAGQSSQQEQVSNSNIFNPTSRGTQLDSSEQDVIGKTYSVDRDTPDSFGLSSIPKDVGKGIAAEILSLPQDLGSTLVEFGETVEQLGERTFTEKIKFAFAKRFSENLLSEGEAPNIFEIMGFVFGTEVDLLTDAILNEEGAKQLTNSGYALIEENKQDLEDMNLIPRGKTSISYDIGAGLASVIKSVGLTVLTKNPSIAAAHMGWTVNSRDYLEARKAGKTPDEAASIAAQSAAAQSLVEQIGGRYFLSAARKSPLLKRFLLRTAGQSLEEGVQSVIEQTIKNIEGVRDTPIPDAIIEVGYSMMIGAAAGAPVVGLATRLEARGKKLGLDDNTAKTVAKNLVENSEEVSDAMTAFIDKETTGLGKNLEKVQESKNAVKEVIARKEKQIAEQLIPVSPEEQKAKRTAASIEGVIAEGIEGVPQKTVASVGKKLIAGTELTTTETTIGKEIIAESQIRLALEEGKTVKQIREQQAVSQKQSLAELKAEVNTIIDLAKFELDALQKKAGIDPELKQFLADKAAKLNTPEDIQNVNQVLEDIDSRLAEDKTTKNQRKNLRELRKKIADFKKTEEQLIEGARRVETRLARLEPKEKLSFPKQKGLISGIKAQLASSQGESTPESIDKARALIGRQPLDTLTLKELNALENRVGKELSKGARMLADRKNLPQFETDIKAIEADSVPISTTDIKTAGIGEQLTTFEVIQNRYTAIKNNIKRRTVALNPMDVFFDMLDGAQNYKGANHRIFKRTMDENFTKYLNLKEKTTRRVKELTNEFKLNENNFDKIGAWAVLQQEGGLTKLLDSGFSRKDINNLTLTKNELEVYNLMRRKLDSLFQPVRTVMRDVYGKNVIGVRDYFPFLTDHNALQDIEIQDQLGEELPVVGARVEPEKGFTIERTLGPQQVRIDALGVFLRHVDNAAYLVSMAKDIRALGILASSGQYEKAVGTLGQEMTIEWINLLARKGNAQNRVEIIDTLRRNIGVAVLGFKLSTIFVQPTALADGAALVGGRFVADGVTKVARPEWRKFLWDNVPEIRERAGDDPAYLDLGGQGRLAKAREAGFLALKFVDSLTASSVAIGAYIKSVEQRGGTVDLKNPDPVAIQEAQLMMRRTQASAFAKDTPAIISQGKLTGNESVDRLILQFQSFMLNRWSLIKHDLWAAGIKSGQTKQAVNVATWLMLATAAEVGLRFVASSIEGVITGDEPDPLDEVFPEKFVKNLVTTVPFVSQGVSAFEYGSVPVPAISIAAKALEKLKAASRAKNTDTIAKNLGSAALLGIGVVAGIPGVVQAESLLRKINKKKKKGKKKLSTL